MLILLAPSKTMDVAGKVPSFVRDERPLFIQKASVLAGAIKRLNISEIERYMHVSPAIAARVQAMYKKWQPEKGKPALWAYRGDVYKGMKADFLDEASAEWAQKHLLIMSGLYGMVRPFDTIGAYRLEMKASIPIHTAKSVYDFWGVTLTDYVERHACGLVYNLASDEYARPVIGKLPKSVRIVTPAFYDNRPNGTVGRAPIYNKMMRGVMARWMIDNRVKTPEGLQDFSRHGYAYDAARSTVNNPAFYREEMMPLIF